MEYVKDFKWQKGITVKDFVHDLSGVGYQSVELGRASKVIAKMKRDGAKIYLTFTSNMVTSGLRGFFAQIVKLGMADAIVTTVGSLEEDIMRAHGEKFIIGSFHSDDVELHEKGLNRIGNLFIDNQSYLKFEAIITQKLKEMYARKPRWTFSELLREVGLSLNDEDSFLYQAAKRNIPVFCPAITDGSFGFHLFIFQQDHPDFVIDVVRDFKNLVHFCTHDERKGIISLGGGVSKHQAILATLLQGGADYAVYMTTASPKSGSVSGATTEEAKSWGKIKDDSDAATVIGDVTILFPLAMIDALETLHSEGLLQNG